MEYTLRDYGLPEEEIKDKPRKQKKWNDLLSQEKTKKIPEAQGTPWIKALLLIFKHKFVPFLRDPNIPLIHIWIYKHT